MACPGGSEIDAKAVDGVNTGSSCSNNCWATGSSAKSDYNESTDGRGKENLNDGIYEDHDEEWENKNKDSNGNCTNGTSATACNDNCINGCANCSGVCGSGCTSGCSSGCSGCDSGCSGSCSGGCSGKCNGTCKGNCTGGCESSCQGLCNRGCSNQEQLDNVTDLERIVRAPNIQKIFRFLIYELEKRRNFKIPQSYKDNINQLTGWKKEQEETLMYLYYTTPRIFEKIFEDIIKETLYQIQSNSLDPENEFKPFYPKDNFDINKEVQAINLMMTRDVNDTSYENKNETLEKRYDNNIIGYPGSSLPQSIPSYLTDNEHFSKIWGRYNPENENRSYYPKNPDKHAKPPNKPNTSQVTADSVKDSNENENENEQPNQTNVKKSNYYYAHKPSAEIWVKKAHELYNEMIGIYDAK